MSHGQGSVRRPLRPAFHKGHGRLIFNPPPTHEIPDSPQSDSLSQSFYQNARIDNEAAKIKSAPMNLRKNALSPWSKAAIAIIPVICASILGQWATYPNIASWYENLVKPSFNPAKWIFAPVWTLLYILMAYAVWRVLKVSEDSAERRIALTLFFLQLTMNAMWSWLFFGLHNPLAGLFNIVPQLVLILVTIDRFRRLDALAALCLVPLAAWVAFASLLNFAIWRLNV